MRQLKKYELYCEATRPTKCTELAIHPKKIKELETWINDSFAKPNHPRVLYLSGPTGSGKSTAVEVICRSVSITLIEYEEENLFDVDFEDAVCQLAKFIVQSGARLTPGKPSRTILFVTNLPDEAFRDAQRFRSVMEDVLSRIKLPVIFCLSDVDSLWHLNPNRLITQSFVSENNITLMKFRPIAPTFLKKALQRAASLLSVNVTSTKINTIAEASNGDLRLALNMLQMNEDFTKQGRKFPACVDKANKEETFHMLGRILYAKRKSDDEKKSNSKKRVNVITSCESSQFRAELEHDVTDIIQMSSMSGEKVVEFLHEHELKFCQNIANYRKVIDAISLSDILGKDWAVRQYIPDEYQSQISARNIMWYNHGEKQSKWYALNKPIYCDLVKEINKSQEEIRSSERIGDSQFCTLSSPYQTIIEDIRDPNRIECYLARPMIESWKIGRDMIHQNMVKKIKLKPQKKPDKNASKTLADISSDEEYRNIVIEESDYDSFDDF